VLDAQQEGRQGPHPAVAVGDLFGECASRTDERIQLFDDAISLDAGTAFGHSMATHQAGIALVAAPRMDAVDVDTGGVEGLVADAFIVLSKRTICTRPRN